jgi:hypothetical protein
MDVQRGVRYEFHGALPTLLGAANSTGATQYPGRYEFHGRYPLSCALPNLLNRKHRQSATEFLAETKFAQRYTRKALPSWRLDSRSSFLSFLLVVDDVENG